MSERAERHILPPRAAAGTSDRTGRSRTTLPDDLVRSAAGRLRALAGLAAFGALVAAVVPLLSDAGFGNAREVGVRSVIFGICTGLSLALIVVCRVVADERRVLRVGLVWYVAMLVCIAGAEATTVWGELAFAHGLPTPIALILVFPVLVPTQPRRFVIASLIGAGLMVPAMIVVPGLCGNAPPTLQVIGLVMVPVLAITGMATVAARVIYKLGRDLKQARQEAQKAGSYQLVAPLGKGGMGEVWRARHGMLAREAAIKLIRRDVAQQGGEEAIRRFQHEARVVASLCSPHTIQLWDYGVTDDGALYYAMELLDGMDFDRLVMQHGPVPPERAVHFLVQACHSLAEAHTVGLVHRDIKPGNLFVTRRGRDVDIVKLLDFGLATQTLNERLPDARVTVDGMIMGTPAYMAPEQVLGDLDIDGRADLYGLGAVAFFLLTGRDVFQATTATQVMFAHLNAEPDAPSRYARQAVPPELDAIILKCLSKKPDERYPSAEALATALRAVPLSTPWTLERGLAWWDGQGASPESDPRVIVPEPGTPLDPGAGIADTRASPVLGAPAAPIATGAAPGAGLGRATTPAPRGGAA